MESPSRYPDVMCWRRREGRSERGALACVCRCWALGEGGWEESEAQMSEVLSSWEGEVMGVCSDAGEVGEDIMAMMGSLEVLTPQKTAHSLMPCN